MPRSRATNTTDHRVARDYHDGSSGFDRGCLRFGTTRHPSWVQVKGVSVSLHARSRTGESTAAEGLVFPRRPKGATGVANRIPIDRGQGLWQMPPGPVSPALQKPTSSSSDSHRTAEQSAEGFPREPTRPDIASPAKADRNRRNQALPPCNLVGDTRKRPVFISSPLSPTHDDPCCCPLSLTYLLGDYPAHRP